MARIRVGSTSDPLSHIAAVGAKTLISLQNTKARNCEGHIDSIIPLTLLKRVSAALFDMCTISLAVAQVHAKVECIGRSCKGHAGRHLHNHLWANGTCPPRFKELVRRIFSSAHFGTTVSINVSNLLWQAIAFASKHSLATIFHFLA